MPPILSLRTPKAERAMTPRSLQPIPRHAPIETTLEEITQTGHTLEPHDQRVFLDEVTEALALLATQEGFCAGAVLDLEWGELLAVHPDDTLDVELAAQLALAALPHLHGQWPQEQSTTSATYYELICTQQGPMATLFCYTLWDRQRTNFALAHAALRAASAVMRRAALGHDVSGQ